MPIYEYRCTDCDKTIEIIHRHTDYPLGKECDECGHPMDRLFPTPNFQFKGAGWTTKQPTEDV